MTLSTLTTLEDLTNTSPTFVVSYASRSHITYADIYNPDVRIPCTPTPTPTGGLTLHATNLTDHLDAIPVGYTLSLYSLLILQRITALAPLPITVRGTDTL